MTHPGATPVPGERARARYRRLWSLVAEARASADRTTVLDNSRAATPFRVVTTYERGSLVGTPTWPRWTPPELMT